MISGCGVRRIWRVGKDFKTEVICEGNCIFRSVVAGVVVKEGGESGFVGLIAFSVVIHGNLIIARSPATPCLWVWYNSRR